MDRWTLHGDRYSLLRSPPHTSFSLPHRDGTPNHVEIFDITNSPNQRGAISETTCLCDIFGDDCESSSAPSSPSVGSFVHSYTEVERTTVGSPLVDDLNDSSGSYHTAPGSIEGEGETADQTERIYSPVQQGESGVPEQSTVSSEISKDSRSSFELKSKPYVPQLNTACGPSEFDNTDFGPRTSSPERDSSSSLCSQETASLLCYPSETSGSPSLLHPESEQVRQTYGLKIRRHNSLSSLSHQSLTPSPSCEPVNSITSSSESVNNQCQFRETELDPGSAHLNKNTSISPGSITSDLSIQSSNLDFRADLSPHSPSSGYTESPSIEALPSSEPNNTPHFPENRLSSPFYELRGRVSLPDLMSRGTTPDYETEQYSHCSDLSEDLSTTEVDFKSTELAVISKASPGYNTPSPVKSLTPYVDSSAAPELKHNPPSTDLLSAPSPLGKSGSRTSSPAISRPNSASSEYIAKPHTYSPVISYSLPPSPGIRSTCSSIESTHTGPSPEIRITESSPPVKRRDHISEKQTTENTPLLGSAPSRSATSSPHISGISYSAVLTERGHTSLSPELRCHSSPESDITLSSPTRKSSSPSPDCSPVLGFSKSEQQAEVRLCTSSPLLMHSTPSPNLGYQSLDSSPDPRISNPSPTIPSPVNRYDQRSPSTLCSEYNTYYLQPTPPLETCEGITTPVLGQHIELETQTVRPEFDVKKVNKANDTKSPPPDALIHSPISNSHFLSEEKLGQAFNEQDSKDGVPMKDVAGVTKNKSFPPSFLFDKKGRIQHISNKAKSLLREEKRLNQHTLNSITPHFTSDHSRQRVGERTKFVQHMANPVNRRKTPSPPLTRFTPVHIIAPEKPRRYWQNRTSPEFEASSQKTNSRKTVLNRETPNISPLDNNNLPQSVGLGKEIETERKMQQAGKRERQCGVDREKHREGQEINMWEEWQRDVSCRGEQVELSFNAKNRKGPASPGTAPTNRESCHRLPTLHTYSESLPTTRQLHEQQSRHKLSSHQEKSRGPTRRLWNPASQNKFNSGSVTNGPGRSSSSSMGSELDEADNEVKWLTDVAFRSLSSPEVDYLDMYNSSHRSSTNISQTSTQESPAGISGAWPTYADFRGSATRLESDDISFQQQSLHHSDGIDPVPSYEIERFECIDVAVEREDTRNIRRGVPKRQIQLKRKESLDDSSENNSPGLPATDNSPSLERPSTEKLLRQYSTPARTQEGYTSEHSPDPAQNERKSKFQKSISLDETCSKTKMATCLIKSVLSKKMQNAEKKNDEPEGDEATEELQKCDNFNSTLDSDYNHPCKSFATQVEDNIGDDIRQVKNYQEKSNKRPSSNSKNRISNFSHTDSQQWGFQEGDTTSLQSKIKSEYRGPVDSSKSCGGIQYTDDGKILHRSEGGDSPNAFPGNTGAPSAQPGRAGQHQECENSEVHKQVQQGDKSCRMIQETEGTIPDVIKKKKASLNVCLTPDAEYNRDISSPDIHFRQKRENVQESNLDLKMVEDAKNEDSKVKGPIHKVRDVRRLVKNTYNLTFKATSCVSPSDITEERIEQPHETNKDGMDEEVKGKTEGRTVELCEERTTKYMAKREEERGVEGKYEKLPTLPSLQQCEGKPHSQLHPMQIQCKAVCWKDNTNKLQHPKDPENHDTKTSSSINREQDKSPLQPEIQDPPISRVPTKHGQPGFNMEAESLMLDSEDMVISDKKPPMSDSISSLPHKEREVSTAVVLIRDGSSQAKTCEPLTQKEVPTHNQTSTPDEMTTTGSTTSKNNHSVSMLLKEKGYQADIGAVVGNSQNTTGGKEVPQKHVNCLEIPLQTSSESLGDPHQGKTISASSTVPSLASHIDKPSKAREDQGGHVDLRTTSPLVNQENQLSTLNKYNEHKDFEAIKRQDSTFPPRSPAIRRFRPQPIEVRSLSKETPKQGTTPNSAAKSPQTIKVKSIAKNLEKPVVPPKPTCKFKPADLGAKTNEVPAMTNGKVQSEEKPQTIVVSSPTIYRKIPSESSSTSNQTKKLAVSAVSSLKPPTSKITSTTMQSVANPGASSSSSNEASKGQQQHFWTAPVRLAHSTTATSASVPSVPFTEDPNSDTGTIQVPESSTEVRPSVAEPNPHETVVTSSNNPKPPAAIATPQAPEYTQRQYCRPLSSECAHRAFDGHSYASDDPPSYDERESFSPLMPDLTHRRPNRYQNSFPPPCSCTAACPPQPAFPAPHHPHHHRSPHNLTPPAPPQSPGHMIPYQAPQPLLRPHQCRADPQPLSFQPSSSPKSSPVGPNQPTAMFQPLHQPPACPPHMPIDPRRLPHHRSPQQQSSGMPGAPYSDPGNRHSPGLPPMDPQYLCGQYGSEYGGDTSSLYSETSYGQTPRRVLLDPETGKYFYIEVPMQPLRKMLFDPETGQYVEVLIPQQGMSHSGIYPPTAAPYTSLHNPNMYGPAPQYLPYTAPPPAAHPQPQHQPPRYPEALSSSSMHPNAPSGSYRNCSGQGPKPEGPNHPPMDQSYLDGMYYVPTGMNTGSNQTPPVYYHKHPPGLPPSGGKRS
ncbi:uncharacterized protein LOC144082600 [Stigmatopora argus]